jgi:hypothetical protein
MAVTPLRTQAASRSGCLDDLAMTEFVQRGGVMEIGDIAIHTGTVENPYKEIGTALCNVL